MSAHIVLSCDGHRAGQPCRGALHTRALSPIEARLGDGAAWRSVMTDQAMTFIDLCPSGSHDEEASA